MLLKSILNIDANFTEDLRFLYESKVPIYLSECSTVVKSSVQLCYASVLLGFYYFPFNGGRFFTWGIIVIVFNCAHLCIICNLEQRLSLELKIKGCN